MPDGFRIGQVLYVIPAGATNVVPVQVIERRTSETTDGVAVKHIVRTHKDKSQPMVLETIKGQVHDDARKARDAMLGNATRAIDGLVRRAVEVAGDYAPVEATVSRTDEVDGYTVTLDGELNAGSTSDLTATVERNGKPVTALEPYLGAFGHLGNSRIGKVTPFPSLPGPSPFSENP